MTTHTEAFDSDDNDGEPRHPIPQTTIAIEESKAAGQFRIASPYSPAFAREMRSLGGKWNKGAKVWILESGLRMCLWTALKRAYPGATGMGPKGPFVVTR